MSFFNPKQPILCKKNISSDDENLNQMKCIEVKMPSTVPLSGIYTCIDQAFIIWGLIAGIIFIVAQFFPIGWSEQAIIWSILTIIGTITMFSLTYSWVKQEKLRWILYLWISLMLFGVAITDLGIFCSWGLVLINLCNFWLLLSAIGYLLTGFGMRSRALFLAAIIHGLAIFLLPNFSSWQFLVTGLVMMSNLLLFSEKQWDRLLPRELNSLKKFKFNPLFEQEGDAGRRIRNKQKEKGIMKGKLNFDLYKTDLITDVATN